MNLLHIDSSILGEQSASRLLSRELVEALRLATAEVDLHYRDLAATPLPVFDATLLAARTKPAAERSAAEAAQVAAADTVLNEFMAADTIVIGAPMYNFAVPAPLKAWLDLIAVAGVSFSYTAEGPVGLATGKRVIVAATAGGRHAGQPSGAAHADYLKLMLGFLGVRDIRVLSAEGLAMGPALREQSLGEARARIPALAAA